MKKKAGFVSIVGKPNVGKSTLLNRLVGCKLAAVSPKPQTTRQTVRGILTESRGQIVFLDTPGIHQAKDRLGERMANEVKKTFEGTDLIYWMVFPGLPGAEERRIAEELKKQAIPTLLLVNKVDIVEKPSLLPVLNAYQQLAAFETLFPISAMRGENIRELLDRTFEFLPENEAFFPDDQVSNQSERFIASEMIREKIFRLTGEEIPYATAVEINEFKERNAKLIAIQATIYVEKKSQRGILIGEKGAMIKQIGLSARRDLERFLNKKVFLELWVKDHKDWRADDRFLDRLEREAAFSGDE